MLIATLTNTLHPVRHPQFPLILFFWQFWQHYHKESLWPPKGKAQTQVPTLLGFVLKPVLPPGSYMRKNGLICLPCVCEQSLCHSWIEGFGFFTCADGFECQSVVYSDMRWPFVLHLSLVICSWMQIIFEFVSNSKINMLSFFFLCSITSNRHEK